MNEPLFQSLIRDLEQQKPIRERLAALRGEKLDALKRETEEAIARAPTESSPDRRKTYERLRELMIDTTRDILLSSLLEATEGITRSGRPEEQPEPKAEQPRAQESAQSSASDHAPKESLNVFEKNPASAATQKPAMGFREWVRSQRGQPAPAEGTWNKIVSWFDVQSPNPEQHYDENIWSKPKYWFAYGVYWLMDWWNGWGKKKPAAAPEQKKQPEALPPAPAKPNPEIRQQAPATSAQQAVPADKPAEKPVQPTQPPAPQTSPTTPSPTLGATPPSGTNTIAKPLESVRPDINLFDTRNQGKSLLSSEIASNVYHVANQRVELSPDKSFLTVNGVNYTFIPSTLASVLIGKGPYTFNQLQEALKSINCSIELYISGNTLEAHWKWGEKTGKHVYAADQISKIISQLAQSQSARRVGQPITLNAICRKFKNGEPVRTRFGFGALDHETELTLVPLN